MTDPESLIEQIKQAGQEASERMYFGDLSYPVKAIPYSRFLEILGVFVATYRAEVRAGGASEATAREYTYKAPNGCDDDYAGMPTFDLEEAREVARNFPHEGDLLERRPATPWVPVKQEGPES